jgi:hypothetical protein
LVAPGFEKTGDPKSSPGALIAQADLSAGRAEPDGNRHVGQRVLGVEDEDRGSAELDLPRRNRKRLEAGLPLQAAVAVETRPAGEAEHRKKQCEQERDIPAAVAQ